MRLPRRLAARVLTLFAVCLLPVAAPADVPLRVTAPEELAAAARTVEAVAPARLATVQRLTGVADPVAPIDVILAPEGSPPARSAPSWVVGYALGERGVVVLMTQRTLTYPDSTLDELLLHEVAHVMISRAAGHRPVPRWFHEGMATVAGSSWGIEDRSRLTLALVRRGEGSLRGLEAMFAGGESRIARAYALSGAVVREMLRRHGADSGARVLREIARGHTFREAFEIATDTPLAEFEHSFWRRYTLWYRWLPIISSSTTLWIGITLLVLWAGKRRHRRSAEIERRWEEEEERFLRDVEDETVN